MMLVFIIISLIIVNVLIKKSPGQKIAGKTAKFYTIIGIFGITCIIILIADIYLN